MKKINYITIIIGLLVSWGTDALIPLTHTVIDFIIGTNLRYPLTHYLLWGYLPVVVSGIYVGFSKANNRVTNAVAIGILYYLILRVFIGAITNRLPWSDSFSFGYALLTRGVICAIVAWISNRIKVWKASLRGRD